MTKSYADVYDPNCPWGYWMTPIATKGGKILYRDGEGTCWTSLREAFWKGRLNMRSMFLADEIMDQMAEVMAVIGVSFSTPPEELSYQTIQFFHLWLNSQGLGWHGKEPLPLIELSDEGRAVLAMLRMTKRRPPVQDWTPRLLHQQALLLPGAEIVRRRTARPALGRPVSAH